MPGNAFIRFKTGPNTGDVVIGESLQETHPASAGWCEISDWSWEIEAETNFLKGTGAAVGVATPGVFNFSHSFDKSSPTIMKNIVLGTSFKNVTVHMLKSTGAKDGKPEVYFAAKVVDAFITKVSSKGGEDGAITQEVEFVFKGIAIGYKKQENTGLLATAIMPFGWNIAEKTMKPGIDLKLDPKSD
jgi:type VI secretion system secreted protein Hcp